MEIIIYSSNTCQYCIAIKDFFKSHGLSFTEKNISENSEFRNQLTERGLKQSEKFNWDNTFNLYIDYYTYLYNKK